MIDQLAELATLLEATVSAGEPPASCAGTWVWGTAIYHSALPNERTGATAGCFYRRTYDMAYRIDVCLPIHDDGTDLDGTEWLGVAVELYDLADAAWCAITAAASEGTLFSVGACEDVTVGGLVITEPLGGIVSAQGSVQVAYPCAVGS